MKLPTEYLLTAGACLVALACGHASNTSNTSSTAATSSTPPSAEAPATKLASPDGDASCVVVDADGGGRHVTLEGHVFVDDAHEHPTRGKTHPYILRLDAARCAVGIEEPRIVEVQLAPSEDVALKPLVGRRVRVSGDPFAAHTAWHARPIVLMTTSAKPIP